MEGRKAIPPTGKDSRGSRGCGYQVGVDGRVDPHWTHARGRGEHTRAETLSRNTAVAVMGEGGSVSKARELSGGLSRRPPGRLGSLDVSRNS